MIDLILLPFHGAQKEAYCLNVNEAIPKNPLGRGSMTKIERHVNICGCDRWGLVEQQLPAQ